MRTGVGGDEGKSLDEAGVLEGVTVAERGAPGSAMQGLEGVAGLAGRSGVDGVDEGCAFVVWRPGESLYTIVSTQCQSILHMFRYERILRM